MEPKVLEILDEGKDEHMVIESTGSPKKRKLSIEEIPLDLSCSRSVFTRVRKICDTAYGSVHYGEEKSSNNPCVLKITRIQQEWKSENPIQEAAILRLLHEEKAQANIVRYIDSGRCGSYFVIALEYCPSDLFNYISTAGPCQLIEAKNIFCQLLSAVQFLQTRGICHLDLSLENLLLTEKKDIRVADFAAAQSLKEGEKLVLSCILPGKVKYMAPELFAKRPNVNGFVADIWSCGIILFILLVGFPPYDTPTLSDARFRLIRSGKLSVLLEKWKKTISSDSLDLLNHMLCPPKDRWDATKLLAHSWFKQEVVEEVVEEEVILTKKEGTDFFCYSAKDEDWKQLSQKAIRQPMCIDKLMKG